MERKIPDGVEFNEEQRGRMIAAIAEVTDIDAQVIKNCRFGDNELAQVFNKAANYNNQLVELHAQSGNTSEHKDWGVGSLMKISNKINRYEGCLQRLASGIVARSNMHPKPPSNS